LSNLLFVREFISCAVLSTYDNDDSLSHTICGSMADIQSATAEIRRGKNTEGDIDNKKKAHGKI